MNCGGSRAAAVSWPMLILRAATGWGYGVDTAAFEAFLESLDLRNSRVVLVVIDEIGKMELFSSRFRALVHEMLAADQMLLATIALHGDGFIREVKQRPDVHLLEVTPNNRERLVAELLA